MRFGIFCSNHTDQNLDTVRDLRKLIEDSSSSVCTFHKLSKKLGFNESETFSSGEELATKADILITVGGDGTILNAIKYVVGSDIPILGVNTGRLGYLTSIGPEELETLLSDMNEKNYKIEQRALLQVTTSDDSDYDRMALNEISVLKKDSSSMITIKAELNGELLNTYWADGLLISTATGSTAYSLSCGGPIVMPGMGNIIITPIAPHNLNVRPLVIDDSSVITLRFSSRSGELLIAADSVTRMISDKESVTIRKSPHAIKLLRQNSYSYLETLRNKLNWGLDKRN